jgi:hypothetical protein
MLRILKRLALISALSLVIALAQHAFTHIPGKFVFVPILIVMLGLSMTFQREKWRMK